MTETSRPPVSATGAPEDDGLRMADTDPPVDARASTAQAPVVLASRPARSRRVTGRRPRTIRRLELSQLPRIFPRHDTDDARLVDRYLGPLLKRLGLFPPADDVLDSAKDAGLALLSLRRLQAENERLRAKRRPKATQTQLLRMESSIRKARLNHQLAEKRLEALAESKRTSGSLSPSSVDDLLSQAWQSHHRDG